jgi:hypothetical protein
MARSREEQMADDRYLDGFIAGQKSHAARISTGTEGRAIWQDAPCPPWCRGRHADGDGYDDRSHYGEESDVLLSCENASESGLPVLRVSLWQHYRESAPRVSLNKGDEIGEYLTLSEAEALAEALHACARDGRDQIAIAGDTPSSGNEPHLLAAA